MKKTIGAILLLTGMVLLQGEASAETISSATYAGVSASTSTPSRVDNISTGGGIGVLNSRSEVKLCSPSGASTVFCGYDVNVATFSASVYFGEEVVAGACKNIALNPKMAYYCKATGASSVRLNIQQAAYKQGLFN